MQSAEELPFLVKLLDDENPVVQQRLAERLSTYPGDLSGQLSGQGIDLPPADRTRLSQLLAPARRRTLREEWFVPQGALDGSEPDWESFEYLLRLLSDLLHDGTTVRPWFVEALDEVASEAVLQGADHSEEDLCAHLFGSGLFRANSKGYYDPRNADLLWIIENRTGNPIGLAVLAMLVAVRLNLEIWGCGFPGHFLAWIGAGADAQLVDCYHRGRLISLRDLRKNPGLLSPEAQQAIQRPCTLREILQRILTNLQFAFVQSQSNEEVRLTGELLQSLEAES